MSMGKHLQGPLNSGAKHTICATYEFSKQGGAVGDIVLQGGDIPKGAVISDVMVDVTTAPTSGGAATIALYVASAADLVTATAVASFTGRLDGVPVDSAATAIKITSDGSVKATIGTAALTAGVFNVFIEYYLAN